MAAPPSFLNHNDDATYSAAVKKYAEMVKELARDKAKRCAQLKKDEERKTKEVEKVISISADELLDKRLKEIAQKVVAESTPQNQGKHKNEVTPGGSPGHNHKSGKGTSKAKGKGKGKSKEQQKAKANASRKNPKHPESLPGNQTGKATARGKHRT